MYFWCLSNASFTSSLNCFSWESRRFWWSIMVPFLLRIPFVASANSLFDTPLSMTSYISSLEVVIYFLILTFMELSISFSKTVWLFMMLCLTSAVSSIIFSFVFRRLSEVFFMVEIVCCHLCLNYTSHHLWEGPWLNRNLWKMPFFFWKF